MDIIDFGADPPPSFEADESLGVDGAPSANTGIAIKWRTNGDVFIDGDIGRQIIAGSGKAWITSLDSARQAQIDVIDNFNAPITAGPNTLTSSTTTVTSTAHGASAGNYVVLTSGAQAGEIRRIATITNANVFEIDNAFSVDQAAPVTWNKVVQYAAGAWLLRLSAGNHRGCQQKRAGRRASDDYLWRGGDARKLRGHVLEPLRRFNRITGYTSPTAATGVILSVLVDSSTADPAAAAAGSWQLRTSSWSSLFGRPRTLTIHGGRLVFGGTSTQPNTFWGSSINSIYNFAVGRSS